VGSLELCIFFGVRLGCFWADERSVIASLLAARFIAVTPAEAGVHDFGFWLRAVARLLAFAAGVSSACRRPSYLSLHAQRKVTQRNGNPEYPLCGLRPQSARRDYGVFRQYIHVLSKNWPASLPATLRAFLHPSAGSKGPQDQEPDQDQERRAVHALFEELNARARAWPGVPPSWLAGGFGNSVDPS
jgi:hypothetical protein